MKGFRIVIASLPHKERVVAEVHYNNMYWVEISQEEEGELVIQFYPHPYEKCWTFSYDEALKVLEQAKNDLLN